MKSRSIQRASIVAITTMAGLAVEPQSADAWYCEAWSNQKVGWAKGWGRSPSLDRAKRIALGNCFARSRGRMAKCTISKCKP